MSLKKKYQDNQGLTHVVTHGEKGLKKAIFDLLKLEAGKIYSSDTLTNESVFVILSGSCSFQGDGFNYNNIGIRKDVFSGKPTSVYLPNHTAYEITAHTDIEIGICSSPSTKQTKPLLITPEDVLEKDLGVMNWTRKAHFIVDGRIDAEFLYVGETLIPPGKWAFPPHRHDHDNMPAEVDMDEIYHFRVNPSTGFGIQISYTDDKSRDESYTLRNGDTTILPDGYHPVGASPVDTLYMLWMMAGEKRLFISKVDENYSWVVKHENLLKQK